MKHCISSWIENKRTQIIDKLNKAEQSDNTNACLVARAQMDILLELIRVIKDYKEIQIKDPVQEFLQKELGMI